MGVFSILKSFRNKNVKCSYCPYMVQYSDIVSELCQKWNDITDYSTVPVSGKYIIACKGDKTPSHGWQLYGLRIDSRLSLGQDCMELKNSSMREDFLSKR